MTLSRAIEIIERYNQCKAQNRLNNCSFQDNDTCAECPLYVRGTDLEVAHDVVYRFVRMMYAIYNDLKET